MYAGIKIDNIVSVVNHSQRRSLGRHEIQDIGVAKMELLGERAQRKRVCTS
jgi:hypothetical protein